MTGGTKYSAPRRAFPSASRTKFPFCRANTLANQWHRLLYLINLSYLEKKKKYANLSLSLFLNYFLPNNSSLAYMQLVFQILRIFYYFEFSDKFGGIIFYNKYE